MSIKITYREEDRPIESVIVDSSVSGSSRTLTASKSGDSIVVSIFDSVAISKQDAAEFGVALIKLAKQS